jgi:cellulose synthase/poly-beta-1,6-N-acetylglucosamine synthase-like glycosyltransferase
MASREGLLFILFICLCVAGAIQAFYYIWFYITPFLKNQPARKESAEPVSVIICARNEAENLRKFLPAVLEQNYPSFEVIVVNDCSEDNSDDVLGEFLQKYQNLRISNITRDPRFTHNKKFAQFIGIKAAANDLLVFTDADCRPLSGEWIRHITDNFTDGVEFVIGYGGYESRKGLLNNYIRYETIFIAMQYLGMAIRGIPYMGVGRNLAYRKEVFFRNKGFGTHNHTMSGDDDLFVNENASAGNTRVEYRPGSFTISVAATNVSEWVKQKQRHLSTGKYYRARDKFLLISEPFSRILFYSLSVLLISCLYKWQAVVTLAGALLILKGIALELSRRRFGERNIVLFSLIFDIFSPFINLSLYLTSIRNRPGKMAWK